MVDSLFFLGFAHALGDMAFQTAYIGSHKAFNPYVMLAHCLIYSGSICIVLKYLGKYSTWNALFLLCGHIIIDYLHIYLQQGNVSPMVALTIDQGLHLVQLLVVL